MVLLSISAGLSGCGDDGGAGPEDGFVSDNPLLRGHGGSSGDAEPDGAGGGWDTGDGGWGGGDDGGDDGGDGTGWDDGGTGDGGDGGGTGDGGDGGGDWDDGGTDWGGSGDDGWDDGGTGGGDDGGTGDDGAPGGEDDGDREIVEADIIQIEGNRLYALSALGGLAVIDVSSPDRLPVLGRYRVRAHPFEMYVEDGQVFLMLDRFWSPTGDAEADDAIWLQSSRLIALDASDPEEITTRGEFQLPGNIQDSRRVGDILYVVTHEDGNCWGCQDMVNTTITSLDVSDEANVEVVDRLVFDDSVNWGSQPRSVTTTNERMYVASSSWTNDGFWQPAIDVVDISDPAGTVIKGASIEVAGFVRSRWQMNEHDGVLRVVTQPGELDQPVLETFEVISPTLLMPLASLSLELPSPESLRSVRFDGPRGYAITAAPVQPDPEPEPEPDPDEEGWGDDPLFTLDLSDPANPRQVGELEMPGWVFHMEPRGTRILALGFDRDNPEGSVNLSLFDVSDFSRPTMVSRVHFGGSDADFAEDQDRIHKAFTILDDAGLVLVPFSGELLGADVPCRQSGVQLIDLDGDRLELRGVAGTHGQARRGVMLGKRLLTVSENTASTFDIDDRDQPVRTASVEITVPPAESVERVATAGDYLLRLSRDSWLAEPSLEIVSRTDARAQEPIGRLSLVGLAETVVECAAYSVIADPGIFSHDHYAYLVWSLVDPGTGGPLTRIEVVDILDPSAPASLRQVDLPFALGTLADWSEGTSHHEQAVVKVGSTLVMSQIDGATAAFEVVDLSDPASPRHVGTYERPKAMAYGGLQAFGDTVVSWHMQPANDEGSRVRFFLDRLYLGGSTGGLGGAADASLAAPVNVPGAVVDYRPTEQLATTVDFRIEHVGGRDWECAQNPKMHYYDSSVGCELLYQNMKRVRVGDEEASLLATHDVEQDGSLESVIGSTERLFAQIRHGQPTWREIVTLAGMDGEAFDEGSRANIGQVVPARGLVSGVHLVLNLLSAVGVVDTADPAEPSLHRFDLLGSSCVDLAVDETTIFCAVAQDGVLVMPLQP